METFRISFLPSLTFFAGSDCADVDCADAAFRLDFEYGIETRVGLHCAPNAHKTLGTFPTGTIRFSFGNFNTEDDVDAAIKALTEICG